MTSTAHKVATRLAELEGLLPRGAARTLLASIESARVEVATIASTRAPGVVSLSRLRFVSGWVERAWWAFTARPEICARVRERASLVDELDDVVNNWLRADARRVGLAVAGDPLLAVSSLALRELVCTTLDGLLAMAPALPVLCAGFTRGERVHVEMVDYFPEDYRWERALEEALIREMARWIGASVELQCVAGHTTTSLLFPASDAVVLPFSSTIRLVPHNDATPQLREPS